MNIDSLFSSILNYISTQMEFGLKDKISLSAFPDEILESTFNECKNKKLISPFAYFVTVCKSKATKKNLKPDYTLINKIKSHPEIQALLSAEFQQKNQQEGTQESSFSGNSPTSPEVSTTFESRANPTVKDGLSKPIAEWTENDRLTFKINQLAGQIKRACYQDADGIFRFHPQDFSSPYATAADITQITEEQKDKPLDDILETFVKKIIPQIQADAQEEHELYKQAQNLRLNKQPLLLHKSNLNCSKEDSVREIATFKDLLSSDWFKNIEKNKHDLAKKQRDLAEAMIKFHQTNINKPD